MGLFQNFIDLVKEELLDEPKKPAKKSGSQKASTSKSKGDSFEQLCAKAKSGDLAAQYNLYDQYADKADKREALEALFTEMMNNGDVEGKGLLACLLISQPEKSALANKLATEALNEGALFVLVMNGFFYANPKGLRRDWNPEVSDKRLIICPVNSSQAVALLEKAAQKLETCSLEVQSTYSLVYGYLSYCYGFLHNDSEEYKYAFKGSELNDSIANMKMFEGYLWGNGKFEKNIDFAQAYAKKVEKQIEKLVPALQARFYRGMASMYFNAPFNNEEKTFDYQEKAANLGSAGAMAVISKWYEFGRVVNKDIDEALSWRNKATTAGYNWSNNSVPDGCI